MSVLKAVLLGVVQGLTEFLPVSSSGHLVLFEQLLGFRMPGLTFDVFVHLGTLAAVIIYYFDDVRALVVGFFAELLAFLTRRHTLTGVWANRDARVALLLLIGSIPAAIVGLLFSDLIDVLFNSLVAVGFFWLVTAGLLALLKVLPRRKRTRAQLGTAGVLVIGLLQSLAIAPGISRSGSTIVGGVLVGLSREEAANFSFLLSLPAIGGATLLDMATLGSAGLSALPWNVLLAGAAAAALSGYLAIAWLLQLVRHGNLSVFMYYTLVLGLAVIGVSLVLQ